MPAAFADHARVAALSRRQVRAARACKLIAVAFALGCHDEAGVTGPAQSGNSVVSDTTTLGAVGDGGNAIAFVSLPPGSVPAGTSATVHSRRTGASLTIPLSNGGFDPTAIAAAAGDVLDVVVQVKGSASTVQLNTEVPPRRRPRVVRTEPPPRSRDVPLNARLAVVFSEPIDPTVVSNGGVLLRLNGAVVAGRLEQSPNGLIVAFTPERPLQAAQRYELIVTDAVRDLDGDPLEAPVQVDFTAASASIPPATSSGWVWGMVVDENGVCIVGATATVVRGQGLGRSIQQKTPCDAWGYDGGFQFWDLTPGVELTIRASAVGYVAREMTVFPASPGKWFSYDIVWLSRIP